MYGINSTGNDKVILPSPLTYFSTITTIAINNSSDHFKRSQALQRTYYLYYTQDPKI